MRRVADKKDHLVLYCKENVYFKNSEHFVLLIERKIVNYILAVKVGIFLRTEYILKNSGGKSEFFFINT